MQKDEGKKEGSSPPLLPRGEIGKVGRGRALLHSSFFILQSSFEEVAGYWLHFKEKVL